MKIYSGHSRVAGSPEEADQDKLKKNIKNIKRLIKKVDSQDWDILQWKLNKV